MFLRKYFFVAFLQLLVIGQLSAQNASKEIKQLERPKLVVGIVVDQMRWDFLYRYYNKYGQGGFKRLLNEGFSCENTMIPNVSAILTRLAPSCCAVRKISCRNSGSVLEESSAPNEMSNPCDDANANIFSI